MSDEHEYPYTLSSILLDSFVSKDIKYLFGVAGSAERDLFDTLIRDYKDRLKFIQGNSEYPAARMSIGYARASEKIAPLILHVQTGPANAGLAVLDSHIANIPIFIFSVGHISSANDYKEVSYGYFRTQELLKEYCKYVYRIVDASNFDKVVRRAFRLAEALPSGPVFLTVSQDVMERQISKRKFRKSVLYNPSLPEKSVNVLIEALKKSEKPVILTQRTGKRKVVHLLVELAEKFGAAVFEVRPIYMNFPSSHPLHQGYSRDKASGMDEYIKTCDLLLAFDCFNPPVAENALNIHISDNPLSFNEDGDKNIFCNTGTLLKSLSNKLEDTTPNNVQIEKLGLRHKSVREEWMKELKEKFKDEPPYPQRLWFEINKIFDGGKDYIVYFAPGYSQRMSVYKYLEKETQGCFYSSLSSAMGAAGEAIGVQLAESRRVICGLGDFEAHIAQLPTLLWTCAHHKVQVVWIVFDNATGAIVKRAFWNYGKYMRDSKEFVGVDLDNPRTDWTKIAEANSVRSIRCEGTEEFRQNIVKVKRIKGPVLLSIKTQSFEDHPEGL